MDSELWLALIGHALLCFAYANEIFKHMGS